MLIHASAEAVYHAFTDPAALENWLAPTGMTGKVHHFDWRKDGGYEMSLYYPPDDKEMQGKTSAKEDRYVSQIIKLIPFKKIIQSIHFITDNPSFAGEMMVEITLEKKENGTEVTFLFKNIPAGIHPEDNEMGTISALEKLARYAEANDEIDEQSSDGSANAFQWK